jgi:hypothetical protein
MPIIGQQALRQRRKAALKPTAINLSPSGVQTLVWTGAQDIEKFVQTNYALQKSRRRISLT